MKVWLLEYFCSDTVSYHFEAIFTYRDDAIDYVLEAYQNVPWQIWEETDIRSEIWDECSYKPDESKRTRLDQAPYLITLREVK